MSISNLTIEKVEQQFASWRSNKKGHKAIPAVLWGQVRVLLKTYRHSDVLRRLGLTLQQARNKKVLPITEITENVPSEPFIQISTTNPMMHPDSSKATTITLQRGDTQLLLNCPSDNQLQLVINALLR